MTKVATYTLYRFDSSEEADSYVRRRRKAGFLTLWSPFADAKVEVKNGHVMTCDVLVRERFHQRQNG